LLIKEKDFRVIKLLLLKNKWFFNLAQYMKKRLKIMFNNP